uniref:Uncharacterized protein n=1 Tax=Piliocolobus tephrosceles TaxID=591936 RepID=A0A8C9H8D3_9PRIM
TGEDDHLWEKEKATSLQERTNRNRLANFGPYPIGRSMMGWIEVEMTWECSWRR